MMKFSYILISIALLGLYQGARAQVKSIRVTDQATKLPIKYAYLFFSERNDAVNCDETGKFEIPGTDHFTDSLSVSAQGYRTEKISYTTAAVDRTIALTQDSSIGQDEDHLKLPRGKQLSLKPYKDNQVFNFTGLPSYAYHPRYQMIAQQFELPKYPALINKLSLSRLILTPGGITEDKLSQTRFRIRFYYRDSISGAPGREITSDILEVTDQHSKTIGFDLSKNKVLINQKSFFVAIEYLRIPFNLQFSRVKSDGSAYDADPFSKTVTRIYQPFLGMDATNPGGHDNIWVKALNGKWEVYDRFSPDLENLAIELQITVE